MGLIFNAVVDVEIITESSKFYGLMNTDWWEHLMIGGLAFGAVYMATDPVTAHKPIKENGFMDFLIGFISIMIRVFNPAYPEGVFLAISINECIRSNHRPLCSARKCEEKIKTIKRQNSIIIMSKKTDGNVYTVVFASRNGACCRCFIGIYIRICFKTFHY